MLIYLIKFSLIFDSVISNRSVLNLCSSGTFAAEEDCVWFWDMFRFGLYAERILSKMRRLAARIPIDDSNTYLINLVKDVLREHSRVIRTCTTFMAP